MMLKSLVGAALLALSLNAGAATTPKLPVFEGNTDGIPSATDVPYSEGDFKKESAAAVGRASRTVAQSANFENMMSPQMKQLRADILSIRSSDELDAKLKTLAAAMDAVDASDIKAGITKKNPYKGDDRDFRYYAAQIIPLQCLKGSVWRFTPLAQKSGVVESKLVTTVYRLSQDMQIMTPQVSDMPSAEAREKAEKNNEQNISVSVFDYMTKPYEGAVLFAEGFDLQEALMNSCYTALRKSAGRLERLDLTNPIVFDNKIYFGVGTFPDDLDRYKQLGEAERHLSLAMKHTGMHFISFFRAYSIKDYFKLQTELGKLYFKDAFPNLFTGNQEIDGVSLQKRANLIRTYHQTFILYQDGPKYLKDYAWPHLVRAVQELNLVWSEVKDRPDNKRMVINPSFLNAVSRSTDENLKAWNRIIEGPAPLHSRLTDNIVTVDLKNFYNSKTPVQDLKTFLPTAFDNQSSKMLDNKFTTMMPGPDRRPMDVTSKYSQYHNWYYGAPKSWNMSAWQMIFPDLKAGDVPETLRTVNEAWGGAILALPLMQFTR